MCFFFDGGARVDMSTTLTGIRNSCIYQVPTLLYMYILYYEACVQRERERDTCTVLYYLHYMARREADYIERGLLAVGGMRAFLSSRKRLVESHIGLATAAAAETGPINQQASTLYYNTNHSAEHPFHTAI